MIRQRGSASRAGVVTLLWLGLRSGRADTVRVLTTMGVTSVATIFLLGALAVALVAPSDGPYGSELLNEPGLRRGVVVALLLLSVPVLALIGQCSRIGAAGRDRRWATYRLAGATPSDARRIAGAETAIAAGFGSILGTLLFLLLKMLLDGPATVIRSYSVQRTTFKSEDTEIVTFDKRVGPVHLIPTDVTIPWWVMGISILLIPVLAAAFSELALRRIRISPFGVIRREEVHPPRLLPAVLFLVGTAGLAAFSLFSSLVDSANDAAPIVVAVLLALSLATGVGLIWGTASISAFVGRLLAAKTQRPTVLIAARRIAADPYNAARSNSVVLLVVLLGSTAQGVRKYILATTSTEDRFFLETLNVVNIVLIVGLLLASLGVLVSVGETVVTSRRSLASLAASGVPPAVLRRSLLLETMLPLVPTTALAATAGVLAARGVFGTTETESGGTVRHETLSIIRIPVPWTEVGILAVSAVGISALMAWAALAFAKRSFDPAECRVSA